MRAVYADTVTELANSDNKVVMLEADLMGAHGTKVFKTAHPDRFINVGIAEANMVGVAAGLSSEGMIPFATTFGTFASRRCFDQFFLSVCYAQQKVILVGSDPGITAKFNGGTHMPFGDTALMRAVPNLLILEPSDMLSARELIKEAYEHDGPVYIRLHRKGGAHRYAEGQKIVKGKGITLHKGTDVTIVATGVVMVDAATQAVEELNKEGISASLVDFHTIKPIDKELLLSEAKSTGAIVTCENAQAAGGMGGAVAEFMAENHPVPVVRVGVQDLFGEVGTQDYLQERFNLTPKDIVQAAKKAISLKK